MKFAVAVCLAWVAGSVAAQDTFVLTSFQSPYQLMEVDTQGRVVATVATIPQLTAYQVLHAANNRDYLAIGQVNAAGFPGAVLDPAASRGFAHIVGLAVLTLR